MRFADLMQYIDAQGPYPVLDGDAGETLARARARRHRDPYIAEILLAIAEGAGCADEGCELQRAQVVAALAPVRLKYMADAAPVEGFRRVERFVQAMDGAFNEEALRKRSQS